MNWNVTIAKAAQKELKRIQQQDAKRLAEAISFMSVDPFLGDIQKMPEKGIWRRRVGSSRIFYKLFSDSHLIYIFEITRRTSKTY